MIFFLLNIYFTKKYSSLKKLYLVNNNAYLFKKNCFHKNIEQPDFNIENIKKR